VICQGRLIRNLKRDPTSAAGRAAQALEKAGLWQAARELLRQWSAPLSHSRGALHHVFLISAANMGLTRCI